MKKIKVDLKQGQVIKEGSAYKEHKLIVDYGVPYLRGNVDVSSQNIATRTGLTQPKLKLAKKKLAEIDAKDLKSFKHYDKVDFNSKILVLN